MIIRNNKLDISTDDVYECTNVLMLYKWYVGVLETLYEIWEKLNEAKAKRAGTGQYADRDWFKRTDMARRLQEILSVQIKERIRELDDEDARLISILRTKFSDEEWAEIIKQLDN